MERIPRAIYTAVMCGILHVSESGYYRWLTRKPSKRVEREGRLEVEIKAAHKRTRETCGPERLQHELKDQGVSVGICRIRKKLGDTVQTEEKVQGQQRFPACPPCGRQSAQPAVWGIKTSSREKSSAIP